MTYWVRRATGAAAVSSVFDAGSRIGCSAISSPVRVSPNAADHSGAIRPRSAIVSSRTTLPESGQLLHELVERAVFARHGGFDRLGERAVAD